MRMQLRCVCYALAVPFDNDAFGEDVSEEVARVVIEQADNLFDVVIVDCPAHTGSALAAWALSRAEVVFMMSGAHSAAVMAIWTSNGLVRMP